MYPHTERAAPGEVERKERDADAQAKREVADGLDARRRVAVQVDEAWPRDGRQGRFGPWLPELRGIQWLQAKRMPRVHELEVDALEEAPVPLKVTARVRHLVVGLRRRMIALTSSW